MRKLLTISLLSAMPVVLAGTALVLTGDGDGGHDTDRRPAASAEPATSSPTTAGPDTRPAPSRDEPAAAAQAPPDPPAEPDPPTDVRFVCPEGGMDAVVDLQHAVDDGHQPWRLSAEDVAAACTFGVPGSSVEAAGTNRYRVAHPATGESAVVDLAQPLGPGTIWVATHITFAPPAAPAGQCDAAAILPVVRAHLEQPGGPGIARVDVRQCQNGYARVFAHPDDSTCGHPDGSCFEVEQVLLRADGGGWTYLTSGTSISCQDPDILPNLSAACSALGLR